MPIIRITKSNYCIIEIEGFFSIDEHDNFSNEIEVSISENRHVIVDLTKTKFIDSSSLGLVLRKFNEATTAGLKCSIVVTREEIYQIFDITGLIDRLNIYDSIDDAENFTHVS